MRTTYSRMLARKLETPEQRTKRQCEQLEGVWTILSEAAIELGNRIGQAPDIFVSLRAARDLINLCKSHPNVADLKPSDIDYHEGFCVACCGSDITARIKCELQNVEDLLILMAMNKLGSDFGLGLQKKTMKAWQDTEAPSLTAR